jgi:hypothetical protein
MRTLLLVTGLAGWTCVVGAGHAGERARRFNPLDATYTLENEMITLLNGKAVWNAEPGLATRTTIGSIGRPANGDLNGDGVADAAIVLMRDAGGSGAYYYVAAAINIGGRAEGTDAKFLIWGDLVKPSRSARFCFSFNEVTARQGATEQATGTEANATVDHSDIRGSEPHNRDPSGAASD